jgi:2-polyprenyl-3-methyl-5-hydroxy-6-metoxy-1,4-benzoquinol methylase
MKDEWNLKSYIQMKYHHMMEEGVYPEEAVNILRKKLLESCTSGELNIDKIHQLFGDIDTDFMKEFWESRAKEHSLNESLTNLEDDAELLAMKVRLEENKILPYLNWKGKRIIDLGSGYGNWAFKFAEKGAKSVTCVDYIKELCEKGQRIAKENGVKNVIFINAAIQDFRPELIFYDVVYIAGVSVHMNDTDYDKLIENIKSYTKPGSYLILRDGTGVPTRHSFDKEYSERLKTNYSAIYRSRDEYVSLFKRAGFELIEDENMFPEDNPLNRFPKTRLRLYKFYRGE